MKQGKKVWLLTTLVLIMALILACPAGAAAKKINVVINGDLAQIDPAPILVEGRVLIPLRAVSEALNAKVEWDGEERKVEVTRGLRTIRLWVPSEQDEFYQDYALINGRYTEMDVPARIINGRTFVPVRLISEGLGAKVSWNSSTNTVSIEILSLKPLEGKAADVRDAVYKTAVADSLTFNADIQVKSFRFPQLNLLKIEGSKDKAGNHSAKGHLGGWFFEAMILDEDFFLKSALFNNLWVGLSDLGVDKEEIESFKEDRKEAEEKYEQNAYDGITDVIRAMGKPVVVSEESINGVTCEKINFVPTLESAAAFAELKEINERFELVTVTLWIGKSDKALHKIDFRVDFNEPDWKTGKDEKGFVHIIADFSRINEDFTIQKPSDFKK